MFKGINEEYKKDLEKLNNGSDFYFYFTDLELVEKNDYRRKCRLLSEELSQKLHSIYSSSHTGNVPPLKFIDFELDIYNSINDRFFFPNENYHYGQLALDLPNCRWLLGLKKTSIQNSEVLSEGTLRINFKVEITCTVVKFSYKTYSRYEEDKFAENKGDEVYSTYKSALQDIENTIQNGNLDFTTLAESMLFLGESYIYSRPTDCFCNSPEEMAPDRIAKYYETHLKKFALIKRIIDKFNDYKNQVIREIIQKAQKQGNRKEITNYQTDQLEKDIETLVEAKKKSTQERQQAEKKAKENARKEEERLKKEREEREKKEAEEKKQKEKKETEEKDKAAKEQAKRQDELSPEYQNWESQINQITDIQQITHLQDRILADIKARRKDKKIAQKVKENLNKARTGTKEEKEQA
ncbi:3866_t:CDS:2 [Funneliformis geosporum]|uniref:3866_t:CDS:1 n=1 Tax=Funneliformis geosporum TaxID=1117311 RepID=A0A9W4T2N6_9GLOM|nr:3866_t:CDS:2 [Funneliformis geosporum]